MGTPAVNSGIVVVRAHRVTRGHCDSGENTYVGPLDPRVNLPLPFNSVQLRIDSV